MFSVSIENDIIDAIYFGCSDPRNCFRMLDLIADHLDSGEVACFHDSTQARSEREFSMSQNMASTVEIYDKILRYVSNIGADSSGYALLEQQRGITEASGFWMALHDPFAKSNAAFLFKRHARPFSAQEAEAMVGLAHHLFRAVELKAQIERAALWADMALALLNILQIPVFLVDSNFSVVLSKSAAQSLEYPY